VAKIANKSAQLANVKVDFRERLGEFVWNVI